MSREGRVFEPRLVASRRDIGDGRVELCSPAVGMWRGRPEVGALIGTGEDLGELEVLGVMHRVEVPAGARGLVVERGGDDRARQPVGHGDLLVVLDASGAIAGAIAGDDAPEATAAGGALQFCSPSSGRFYARPAPDQELFVQVGDVIREGQTICLLEVMKTFNRVTYGGSGLPETARVVAVLPADEADLDAGDPILVLEPA